MKKIVIVSILVLVLICGLSTVVRAAEPIDVDTFTAIPDNTEKPVESQTPKTESENKAENTKQTEKKDDSVAKTKNPQTGIKEEAPIIIITIIGICVAIYAGRRIKKYNY